MKHRLIQLLPVYGCIATGIVYAGIGVIALLSFFKVRHGGADESSMLAILDEYVIGQVFIWIILLGTICYIIWRFYETITDPYEYGTAPKGFIKRTGIALSTIADALIVYAAIRVLLGANNIQTSGKPEEEQAMARHMLQHDQGKWLLIAIGSIYVATSLIQLLYGIMRGYRERVDLDHFSPLVRNTVQSLAWAGYFARGIILGIIGFFYVKAGVAENAVYVVNTDQAFDYIGDHVGHVYFILTAIGTICYGLFLFAQGLTYDTDKD